MMYRKHENEIRDDTLKNMNIFLLRKISLSRFSGKKMRPNIKTLFRICSKVDDIILPVYSYMME